MGDNKLIFENGISCSSLQASTVAKLVTAPIVLAAKNGEEIVYAEYVLLLLSYWKQTNKILSNLSTRPIAVEVGEKTFWIHAGILCQFPRFRTSLIRNYTVESQEGSIKLPEEDAYLFQIFMEYMYAPKDFFQLHYDCNTSTAAALANLAKLYAMAERCTADTFKDDICKCFISCQAHVRLTTAEILQILEIAATLIPERAPREDAMRDAIFRIAAKHIGTLQHSSDFRAMLDKHPNVTKSLLLRSGKDNELKKAPAWITEMTSRRSHAKAQERLVKRKMPTS
jgi:hypothetical protein